MSRHPELRPDDRDDARIKLIAMADAERRKFWGPEYTPFKSRQIQQAVCFLRRKLGPGNKKLDALLVKAGFKPVEHRTPKKTRPVSMKYVANRVGVKL